MINEKVNSFGLDCENLWKKLSKDFRLAFLSASIIGFIIHLYVFSNLLLSNDASVSTIWNNFNATSSGRWALGFFCDILSGIYQMPVVIGLISLIMLALSAGLTVCILDISHPFFIVLTSGLLVSFPTVACTFAYLYTADAYFMALFMNTLGVYLAKKCNHGWIVSIVLITIACGIYQAYFCYAMGLFLFDCILALLNQEKIEKVIFSGGKYLIILVLGLFFYCTIERIFLNYTGKSLTSYMGMNTIGQLNFFERLSSFPKAYKTVLNYIKGWSYVSSIFRPFHLATLPIFFGSIGYLIVSKKIYHNPFRVLLIILGTLLLPLALCFVSVLAYTANVHRLMIYSFSLFFVFMVKCVELSLQQLGHTQWKQFLYKICIICSLMVIWNNFCLSNIGYHSLQLCYENTFALANRIATQIEMLENYVDENTPVVFVGKPSSNLGNARLYQEHRVSIGGEMVFNFVLSRQFFARYIGVYFCNPTPEQCIKLESSESIAAMPDYPARGSISVIDGIAVVKLGEGAIW